MSVIAVIQQKGGVGKSTIAANLAGELVHAKHSVIVFDLDPQKSLTQWAQLGGGLLSKRVRSIDVDGDDPRGFRLIIEKARTEADFVVLDSPPGFPEAGMMAALVADLAILPVTPSPLDMFAAKEALNMMRLAQQKRGGKKPRVAFIPSKVDLSTNLGRQLPDDLKATGEIVLPGISQRIAVTQSVLEGYTMREYFPESISTEEFRTLAKAVQKLVHHEEIRRAANE